MSNEDLQLSLDDLLADLRHARRNGDLGRLAFVAYCEVRRWARQTGHADLAEQASAMIVSSPHASRDRFLELVDALIFGLEQVRRGLEADTPRQDRGSHNAAAGGATAH